MARLKSAQPPEDESDIDMTPMLDVVFIMLIFFIVTASFVKESGLDMSASEQDDTQVNTAANNNTILIRIEANGRIWIDETITDIEGVQSSVKRLHAQNPEANVVIQPDPKAKTDLMIRVLDQSRSAGVNASISPVFEG